MIHSKADKKKDDSYQKNTKKADAFQDCTVFYMRSVFDKNGYWLRLPKCGHKMAKTKYNWLGKKNDSPIWTNIKAGKGK